jgi:ribonuclease Z
MKVIPLGTSSGKPTLRRNVSALAVVREGEWMLFDCGEGTQTQIIKAGLNPNRLSSIFITHLHGDHFNGLAGLLSTMGLDRRTRDLTMVGPRGINDYLETLARLKILFVSYNLDLREFGPHPSASRLTASNGLAVVYEAEQYRVKYLPLDHRVFTLGYRIEERPRAGRFNLERARELGIPEGPMFGRLQAGHDVELADGRIINSSQVLGPPRPGKVIAYCTDTRPCRTAIELARDVDLLIHEATFTNDMAEEAREFGHSTARQAAEIAREANAKRLLITHFSTRYPDPRVLLDEAREVFPETILADDLLEVDL